jgi:hypothetical protein
MGWCGLFSCLSLGLVCADMDCTGWNLLGLPEFGWLDFVWVGVACLVSGLPFFGLSCLDSTFIGVACRNLV